MFRSPNSLSLKALALATGGLFLLTFGAVHASGFTLDLPWNLLALLVLAGLPFSICFHWLADYERRRGEACGWPVCLAIAMAVLLGNQYFLLWPVLALLLRPSMTHFRRLLLGATVLVSGYGVVWNLNFLLMRYMPPERWDPLMRSIDLALYRLWFGPDVNLTGMFPISMNRVVLQLFDNAYAILIPEIVLVAFLFSQRPQAGELTCYLRRLFGFYLAGIVIYTCFPVNGPHLYYPEQQDLTRSLPSTVAFAAGMMHDYQVAKVGGQLSGFGYFIAVPSLHVLGAIYLQHSLYTFPILFRVFLPINIALCLSTVVLGYHYLLDSVAAAAVYAIYLIFARKPWAGLYRRWRRSMGTSV